jgi:hypothetical protein
VSNSERRKGPSFHRIPALALILFGASLLPRAATADVLLGGTAPRGFFGWEAIGGYERPLPTRPVADPIDFPIRIEAHFATRDNVTNLALSTYLLARLRIPGFDKVDFGPYLATGPGLHIQGSWSDLQEFGGVVVEGKTVSKWHVLAGATLIRGERADLYVEGRYTKPGPYDFDYIAFGVLIHGPGGRGPAGGSE